MFCSLGHTSQPPVTQLLCFYTSSNIIFQSSDAQVRDAFISYKVPYCTLYSPLLRLRHTVLDLVAIRAWKGIGIQYCSSVLYCTSCMETCCTWHTRHYTTHDDDMLYFTSTDIADVVYDTILPKAARRHRTRELYPRKAAEVHHIAV